MNEASKPIRQNTELQRRSYSDEETLQIYELGRWYFENGDHRSAEVIATGLCEVAPSFIPGWLLLGLIQLIGHSFEKAVDASAQALKLDSQCLPAQLISTCAHLSSGDLHSAGTQLGEIGERVAQGDVQDPMLARFYRIQLARYREASE